MPPEMPHDSTACKLHVAADGTVWFADGNQIPVGSGIKAGEFCNTLQRREGYLGVRMLGTHNNAALVTMLHRRCQRHGRLEVASPSIGGSLTERAVIDRVFHRMRTCTLPPSLGGWHAVTDKDYPAYGLVVRFQHDRRFNDHARQLLKCHPAWHDLRMLPTLDAEWAAWLLTFIIDPRWFIDLKNVNRVGRLKRYLGLTPRHIATNLAGDPETSGPAARCRTVLGSWYNMGSHDPGIADRSEPANFLWRIFDAAGGGVLGALRASQAFVVYLRHTWLQALSWHPEIFVPEAFFKNTDEITAYKAHAAMRSRTV